MLGGSRRVSREGLRDGGGNRLFGSLDPVVGRRSVVSHEEACDGSPFVDIGLLVFDRVDRLKLVAASRRAAPSVSLSMSLAVDATAQD